jgi:D-sedoheptulose 7-phosphate isomerase
MELLNEINDYLDKLQKTIESLNRKELNNFINLLLNAREKKSTIFIFGNGGSALTASHFASDLNKGASYGMEKRFRVIALTDNYGLSSAYANDLSFDEIFIEQLKNFLEPEDLVIGISGSGNSKNIIKAIEYANLKGNTTIGITGFDGGKLKQITKHNVNANIQDMQISEDIHIILNHLTVKIISNLFINKNQ